MSKKILSIVLAIVLVAAMAMPSFAEKSDVPVGATVIYADSWEDAMKQIDAISNSLSVSDNVSESSVISPRVNLTGLHFQRSFITSFGSSIILNYYFDTVSDRPSKVYNEYLSYNQVIGSTMSTNNLYCRIVNGTTIRSTMDVHTDYKLLLKILEPCSG